MHVQSTDFLSSLLRDSFETIFSKNCLAVVHMFETSFSHHHSICFPFSIGISSSSHWLVRVHGDISLFIPDTGNLYFFYLLFLINLLWSLLILINLFKYLQCIEFSNVWGFSIFLLLNSSLFPHGPVIHTIYFQSLLGDGLKFPLWPFIWLVLEKAMATHSSTLAWRIPGTEEPSGLPSMGSHRVGHDWSDLAAAACFYF